LTIHDAALSPEEIARRATPFDQRGDSFDRVTNDRIDIGAFEADPIIAPELDGDFDDDGDYDCQDVDALVAEIVLGSNDFQFDLSEDGVVDGDDLTLWLAEAGAVNNASGGAYLNGDANLDGVVDISDFNVWNANKFTTNSAWCTADFNTDGVVDISDFNVWNANKFTASDAASQTGNASSEEDEPRVASSLVDSESPEESDRQELATLDRNSIRGPVVSPRFVVRETDREAKEQNLLEAVFGEW
jgi:hypothetical protein